MNRSLWDIALESPFEAEWENYPPLNLSADNEKYVVVAALPGVSRDDLEIMCTGRNLTIRGERKDSSDPEQCYQRCERPTGTFVRMIELPGAVEADRVNATLQDGILEITVPKASQAKSRRIDVKPGATQPQHIEAEKKEA